MVMKRIKIRSNNINDSCDAKVLRFDESIEFATLTQKIVVKLGMTNNIKNNQGIEEQFELWLEGSNRLEETDEIDNGDEVVLKKKTIKSETSSTGEYDVILPFTTDGLLLLYIAKCPVGSIVFVGYRKHPVDGSKGPTELNNLIRKVGDKIIAINGKSTIGKSMGQVKQMLKKQNENQKFVCVRFLKQGKCSGPLLCNSVANNKAKGGNGQITTSTNSSGNDSTVEDVTEQCLEQRRSKRKIVELSSGEDEDDGDGPLASKEEKMSHECILDRNACSPKLEKN